MITVLLAICAVIALLATFACLRGGYHMVKAARSGDTRRLKALAWAELRIGLMLVGSCVIVATHGQGIRIAQVLLIIAMTTRLPADLRVLRR